MKFLLDHDVPVDLSFLLEQLGHDVTLLRKFLPENASDEVVLQFAHERGCVPLTCNRDDFQRQLRLIRWWKMMSPKSLSGVN